MTEPELHLGDLAPNATALLEVREGHEAKPFCGPVHPGVCTHRLCPGRLDLWSAQFSLLPKASTNPETSMGGGKGEAATTH